MKRSKLSKRDAESRYQLARDYRLELKDDATAIKLLSEAIEIDPDPVRQQELDELKTLGFVKEPRGWVRGDPAAIPAATDPNSPRDTLPRPNMTADQVRQLLRNPRPDEVLRVGIAGQVLEQWSLQGPPDIYVTFRLSRSSPAVVVSVHTQK
ncbi:MAG: hypothetical protein HY000_09755 [Planctomycetes bacterium]|nr:hypothetical protein [Planctomycetota bacterium]